MKQEHTGKLGTFAGVFTPSILTILGIILFRRTGYVVGHSGLWNALLMVALANMISVLTSVSLSAIATNFTVKGGGDYYLISRTLGREFGGAIGIVLFLAQSVSIAFYCIGFGEAIAELLPFSNTYSAQLLAGGAMTILFIVAWFGADFATKFQYVVMAVLGVAILSFFVGGLRQFDFAILQANWAPPPDTKPFWIIFAIFFPAATGFTQGVSMSGDLKDPGHSLPLGTFMAVGLSIVVYVAAIIIFAGVLPANVLAADFDAMKQISLVGWLVTAGVIAATLSSAMASFLGAPRILQSLASDKIFPLLNPFAHGVGRSNNPRRGVLFSLAIAIFTVVLGNLNVIAPIVSMFFLISYGLLNYATWHEARANSPSFRPRFRWFHRHLSLAGAIACLGIMLAINPTAGAGSIVILFAIFQYLKRTARIAGWADNSRSFMFQQIKEDLFCMAGEIEHPRDWRPQILAFSDDQERRERLLHFGTWIEGRAGLTTAIKLLTNAPPDVHKKAHTDLIAELKKMKIQVFGRVINTHDPAEGLRLLIQGYGMGPLRANISLYNWLSQKEDQPASAEIRYGASLRDALRLGCHLVILDADETQWLSLGSTPIEERIIDVWWSDDETSPLMLMLAHLMTRTPQWEHAHIRVMCARGRRSFEKAQQRLEQTLSDIRIEADPVIVDTFSPDSIIEHSQDATLVFIPFQLQKRRPVDKQGNPLEPLLQKLPATAMVLAAADIQLDAEPDEGPPAEIAKVIEEAEGAKRAADDAEKTAQRAAKQAEKALDTDPLQADDAEEKARQLEQEAEKARLKVKEIEEMADNMTNEAQ